MPRNTGTQLFDENGNNRTATHLSTNIVIIVDGNPVGAIQSIDITEDRGTIKMIDEVGTDGHIDSAPQQSTSYSINCERIRFGNLRVAEAFSRGYHHVKSQRIPFDIEIHDRFASADDANAISVAEDIFSVLNSNNVVNANANGLENPIILNPFEQEADRGGQRGSLDGNNLINALVAD
jgi:hypothetical protein